jgi:hypothetical protein
MNTISINSTVQTISDEHLPQSVKSLQKFGIDPSELPFDKLDVGHSFTVTMKNNTKNSTYFINTISARARAYGKEHTKMFRCRQDGYSSVIVLRVA